MKSATSWRGATSVRCPAASSIIASANAPIGVSSHMPSTNRVPERVPIPAMWPVNA